MFSKFLKTMVKHSGVKAKIKSGRDCKCEFRSFVTFNLSKSKREFRGSGASFVPIEVSFGSQLMN